MITFLLLGGCALSIAYWTLSAYWLRARMVAPAVPTRPEQLPPITLFRPIKSGVPDLAGKLHDAASALHHGDELLLGIDAAAGDVTLCEAVRARFPDVRIVIVPCESGLAHNPKINKLLQMIAHARNALWIVQDTEVLLPPGWLDGFRAEWVGSGHPVFTAGYRFSGVAGWLQRLDAAPVLLTLWPGLATVERFGGLRFALGACLAVRRADMEANGSWGRWADHLAEDHALGQAMAAAGHSVGLSRSVLTLGSDPLRLRDYWRHQHRAAVTYRVANPAGFAGQLVTHGVTFALLLLILSSGAIWAWLVAAIVCAARLVTAEQMRLATGFLLSRFPAVLLLASILETVFWLAAWCTRRVWWGGCQWRVNVRGILKSATPGR